MANIPLDINNLPFSSPGNIPGQSVASKPYGRNAAYPNGGPAPRPAPSSTPRGSYGPNTAARKVRADEIAKQLNWNSIDGYTQPYTASRSDTNTSFILKPTGDSYTFNIVKDFDWTKSKYRDEVPRLQLKELQITGLQQLNYYSNNALKVLKSFAPGNIPGDMTDPYLGLYETTPTNFNYIFPYYDTSYAKSSHAWTEKVPTDADYLSAVGDGMTLVKGGLGGLSNLASSLASNPLVKIAGVGLGNLVRMVDDINTAKIKNTANKIVNVGVKAYGAGQGSPYAGIEQPMYYSGTTKNTYTITFPLFNTSSLQEIRRNLDFIRAFQFQNLINRTSVATYTPPVIYQSVPNEHNSGIGLQYFYVDNFMAKNIGAIRSIDIKNGGIKVPVPEAYEITISLREMITSSRNLYSSVMSNNGSSIVSTFRG